MPRAQSRGKQTHPKRHGELNLFKIEIIPENKLLAINRREDLFERLC